VTPLGQPGSVYWALVEPFWIPLNESWDESDDGYLSKLRSLPAGIASLYSVHWCDSEVCNGGFHQFFWNTTGIVAPEALEGFRAIGAQELAEIVAEAMARLGRIYSRDRRDRQIALASLQAGWRSGEVFEDLDHRFYAWLDSMPNGWHDLADEFAKHDETASS